MCVELPYERWYPVCVYVYSMLSPPISLAGARFLCSPKINILYITEWRFIWAIKLNWMWNRWIYFVSIEDNANQTELIQLLISLWVNLSHSKYYIKIYELVNHISYQYLFVINYADQIKLENILGKTFWPCLHRITMCVRVDKIFDGVFLVFFKEEDARILT